ncbi:MAG: uracil-DNA glycosylase [Actinomycetota bacterium]
MTVVTMIDELARQAATCTRCRLSEGRTQVVFGVGHPTADLMFIGEAPGFHEDKRGEPFVGAAGQLLTTLLGEIGLRREDVYIANVLRCRPPGNRDPMPDEIEACTPWLEKTLGLVDPRIIMTLGNFATRFILGRPIGISRVRGQTFHVDGRIVIPTFHPAALIRGGGAASRQMADVRADFQAVRQALHEVPPPPPVEQLDLF